MGASPKSAPGGKGSPLGTEVQRVSELQAVPTAAARGSSSDVPSAAAAPDNLTTGTRTSRTSGVVTAPSLRDLSGALSLLPPVSALPLPPLPPLLPQHVEIPASVARDGRAFVWHPQPTGVGLPSGSPVFPASPELVPRDRAARAAARGERAANRTGAASCPRPWDLLLRAHIDRKSSSMASAEVAVAESDNKGGGRGGAGHGRGRHSGVETAPARTSPRRRAGSLSPEGRAGHEGASAGHARVMGMEVPDVEELTDIEEQRRIRRLIKNRATAQASRERKRQQLEDLQAQKEELLRENEALARLLSQRERECQVERERLRLALAKAMRGAIP